MERASPFPSNTLIFTNLSFMGKVIRTLFLAVFLSALLGIALPILKSTAYIAQLAALPRPTSLRIPVAHISPNAIRDSWHAPRDGGRRRHEGIDIFARKGTPVHSTTEGIVMRIREGGIGGKVVWVLGPGGQRHYYAHLDGFAYLSKGQRVEPGSLLGYVGNTGNAKNTPPHLHYGIYNPSGAINPYPLLRQVED